MNYQFHNPYAGFPGIYNGIHLSDTNMHDTPLLYHHQPPSPNGSPTSSTSGSNYGQPNAPMGQGSPSLGIPAYPNSPEYHPGQAYGQGYSSSGGFGASRSQPYGSVGPQYPSSSHLSPSDHFMDSEMERYVNYDGDGSNPASSPTSPALSNSRTLEDPPQPSIEITENYLRKSMSIPENRPLNLSSLPDEPFGTKPPKISDLIKLAIWGSPNHRLTLRQIYDAVERRYPSWKDAEDKPWQRSIRHNLSLKAMFVRLERPQSEPGKGYYWTLNVAHGDGNKRDRKRKDRHGHTIKEEEEDTDFSNESQGYDNGYDTIHLARGPHYPPNSNTNQRIYDSGNTQQVMMQGQTPYMAQLPQGTYNSSAGAYMGMGSSQNMPLAGPPFAQSNPAWGTHPSMGNVHPQGYPYPQQGVAGSSHRHHQAGRHHPRSSQQQPIRPPHVQMPMQGGSMLPMEGVSHSSRSSRRSHSDTSPDADDEEMARSAPRQRSANRS